VKNIQDFLPKSRRLKILFLIAISVTASYVSPTRTAHSTEVSVGVAFTNARVAPLWIADKEGFFKKNGIEAKILKLAGGTQGAQALLSRVGMPICNKTFGSNPKSTACSRKSWKVCLIRLS